MPVDRRLCVATFRWVCLCRNRVELDGSTMERRTFPPRCARASFARPSGRGQEIDRIEDRERGYVLGSEIEGVDAVDDLGRELRRPHVRGAQLAERYAAVGLDPEAQDHLALQRGIVAQLSVVEAVERGLVAVEDDLDLFVRAADRRALPRAHAAARTAAAAGDRARRARDLDTRQLRAAAVAATAAHAAAQRGEVDPAARTRRLRGDHRALCRHVRHVAGIVDLRFGAEPRDVLRLRESRELLAEGEDALAGAIGRSFAGALSGPFRSGLRRGRLL